MWTIYVMISWKPCCQLDRSIGMEFFPLGYTLEQLGHKKSLRHGTLM